MLERIGLRPSRWTPLRLDEERLLLDLAMQRGPVGDTALGVLTHLPLRPEAREQMRTRLDQLLVHSESQEQDTFLRKVADSLPAAGGNWPSRNVDDVFRTRLDAHWMYSPGPGFSSFTDKERAIARRKLDQELPALAEQVRAAWHWDKPVLPFDPLLVTLLFELAAHEDSYDVMLGNGIVVNIAKISAEFRPDVPGLFLQYFSAARNWALFVGKTLGPWYLYDRDDEDRQCWRSWQLAWVLSRGGLADAVGPLRRWLKSSESSAQIAALALLADVADYVVQREPEQFGGGRRPPRIHPNDPAYSLADAPLRLGVSAPRAVVPRNSFVARLVAYTTGDEERAESLLRGARCGSEPALDRARCRWPVGTRVDVTLSADHPRIDPAHRNFVWAGEAIEAVFDVTVLRRVPDIVLRFDVSASGVPTANLRLEVAVTTADVKRQLQVCQGRVACSAFASYAKPDRLRVLDGVNTMRSIGIDVFMDCLDLHPGNEWETRLATELSQRDLFVLFWSKAASESQWVSWELNKVLSSRGKACVCVNPLEPEVDPPQSLSELHFSGVGAWVRAGIAIAS